MPGIDLLFISLSLKDTPLGYTPPLGPAVNLSVFYNQRESAQPANFTYSNLGPKWTFGWTSYLVDDPTHPYENVRYYRMGGFTRLFKNNGGGFSPQLYDQTKLTRLSAASYEILWPDGSKAIFAQPDGSAGNSRKLFLTQLLDPAGDGLTFTYDASLRLAALTDALGQVTTLTYGLPADPYKITQITDPFGRSASFDYDSTGRLAQITDVIGLASQFHYDGAGDFINELVTPYGSTTFVKAEAGTTRSLEIRYPDSNRERAEFNQTPTLIPDSEPSVAVPTGMRTRNQYLVYRNTYYWSRTACALAYGDYTKAKIYHWLHFSGAAGIPESVKEPLENR
ncbi:MAG: RHS repeat protein, partial [Verrucomicrobiae bacterium]|nr:RHS repeat protein [Verrucomicrobiae bacterium]